MVVVDEIKLTPDDLLARCVDVTRRRQDCAGVYMIHCAASGNAYIGSSASVYHRLHAHRSRLKSGTHTTVHLQRAYSLYGEARFRFVLLEPFDMSVPLTSQALVDRENHYLVDVVERARLYNTTIPATVGRGSGFRHSEEACARMSATWQRKFAEGYRVSDETRAKIAGENAGNAKLTEDSVRQVKELRRSGMKRSDIAAKFGISVSTVSTIIAGRSWQHLPDSQDKVLVGRLSYLRGVDNHNARLTEDQVREIKAMLADGLLSQREIGERFGVGQVYVSRIKLGQTWKHLM